jgi:hypothetical protein
MPGRHRPWNVSWVNSVQRVIASAGKLCASELHPTLRDQSKNITSKFSLNSLFRGTSRRPGNCADLLPPRHNSQNPFPHLYRGVGRVSASPSQIMADGPTASVACSPLRHARMPLLGSSCVPYQPDAALTFALSERATSRGTTNLHRSQWPVLKRALVTRQEKQS